MIKIGILECFYPNKCAACGEIISEEKPLCDYCAALIEKTDSKNRCIKCGLSKDNCRCSLREFRFAGVASVYENTGLARKAYYSYKISRRLGLADFFANESARIVKEAFSGIEFDAVCSVPSGKMSLLKRGFDHSGVIARKLAAMLNVRYIPRALRVKPFIPPQHNSGFDARLENVRGKYYTDKRISAKRALLFDDICTSGATLDECAKELMFAGVGEVYCITVLCTVPKKKTDKEVNNGN